MGISVLPKFLLFFHLLLAAFAASGQVRLGGVSDGGGSAVVCRDTQKQITSAELLDLFEARTQWGLVINDEDAEKPFILLAKEAARRIDQGGGGLDTTGIISRFIDRTLKERYVTIRPSVNKRPTENFLEHILSSIQFLPPNTGLKPINDFNNIVIPTNCGVEQVAIYNDRADKVTVVGDIWNSFDNVSKAALLVHEAFYHQLRVNGETTSDRARKAVGIAFSKSSFTHVFEGIPNEVLVCFSDEEIPSFRFAVYRNLENRAVFQFLFFEGKIMLSKTAFTTQIDDSPIGRGPDRPDSGNIVVNTIRDSALEDGVKVAWMMKRSPANELEMAIGTVVRVINDSLLKKVKCTKRGFRTGDGFSESW